MADNTPKTEEPKPTTTETKPVEEKKVEEKTEAAKTESKPEPKPASSASATDEVPDVNTSDEFKTLEEDEAVLLNVYVISWRIHLGVSKRNVWPHLPIPFLFPFTCAMFLRRAIPCVTSIFLGVELGLRVPNGCFDANFGAW